MAAADPQVRIAMLEAALRAASRELQWANLTIQKRDAEIQMLEERLRQAAHRVFGPAQRNAERSATGVAGGGRARRNARGSGSGIAARADFDSAAARAQTASGPQAVCRRICRASKK